jgi:hypothetical protein
MEGSDRRLIKILSRHFPVQAEGIRLFDMLGGTLTGYIHENESKALQLKQIPHFFSFHACCRPTRVYPKYSGRCKNHKTHHKAITLEVVPSRM